MKKVSYLVSRKTSDIIESILAIHHIDRLYIFECNDETNFQYFSDLIESKKDVNKALVINVENISWKNKYIRNFFNNGRSMKLTTFICMKQPVLMPPEIRINACVFT